MKPPEIWAPVDPSMPSRFSWKLMNGEGDELVVEHDREVLQGLLGRDAGERVVGAALGDRAGDVLERLAALVREVERDDRLAAAALVEKFCSGS